MKKLYLIITLLAITFQTYTQVGIGILQPSDAAELHIQSSNKGLIIPMVEYLEVVNDAYLTDTNAYGLTVYLKPERKFYSWNGASWQCLNPLDAADNATQVTISNEYQSLSGELRGNFEGTGKLNSDFTGPDSSEFNGRGSIPVGGIIMWSGTTAPNGWVLCDGSIYSKISGLKQNCPTNVICNTIRNNPDNIQTPDLRGRFIAGYSNNTTSSTDDNKYPPYYDDFINNEAARGVYTNIGAPDGDYSITLTAAQSGVGTHSHPYSFTTGVESADHTHTVESYDGRSENNDGAGNRTDVARPGGTRTTSGTSNSHTHSFSGSTDNTYSNASAAHENRPPYYVLAFIMRIK